MNEILESARTIIRSLNVLVADELGPAAIVISKEGIITSVLQGSQLSLIDDNEKVVDFGDLVVLPGVVDSHVHVNEPGRTEWEGFRTATRSAAFAGVTTIVDMPLNSIPPTTTVDNLHKKIESTQGKLQVDVAFWGGLIPKNTEDLLPLVEEGVVGFKCFTCPSGVDEFPPVTWDDVEKSLKILKETDTILAFHAECEGDEPRANVYEMDGAEYETFLLSRPPTMETSAVEEICKLCNKYRVKCHIVHASCNDVVTKVKETVANTGAPLTVETCHHYLTLCSEKVPRGGTMFKCCPPIREKSNQEALWRSVLDGNVDLVVSDHSPCPPAMKGSSDFLAAWGGIASVQFGLSLLWTEGEKRGLSLPQLSKLLSKGPAKLCRLKNKGSLEVGKDADIVVFNPHEEWTITEDIIQHRHKVTPYIGKKLKGRVHSTILRGEIVYQLGKEMPAPSGKTILLKN